MAAAITTAGKALATQLASKPSPRREAIQACRKVLKKLDSSDDEVDDALEALLELAADTADSAADKE